MNRNLSSSTRLTGIKYTALFALAALAACAALISARGSQAQGGNFENKADSRLRRVYENFHQPNPALQPDADRLRQRASLHQQVRLEDSRQGVAVGVILTLRAGGEEQLSAAGTDLEAHGFKLRARIGQIATLTVPVKDLPRLAEVEAVEKMNAAGFAKATGLKPEPPASEKGEKSGKGKKPNPKQRRLGLRALNDAANAAIKAPDARSTYNVTGRGVVVGVIDSGIDWRHGDFRKADGSTRVKFLWDISDTTNSGPGGVGRTYTEAEINAALQNQGAVNEKDTNNHGTHVTGIAAGNGLGTANGVPAATFAGMAPEADLVIVKGTRPGSEGFGDDDQIASLAWIRDRAAQLNEPFVINMSLGGHASQHDGSDGVEKAIDALLAAGANRQVAIAAGNEGQAAMHAGGVLALGGEATIRFTLTSKAQRLLGIYPASDSISVRVVKPNGAIVGPVPFGGNANDADITIENAGSGTDNNARNFAVDFKNKLPGTWQLLVTGDKIVNGRYDVWDVADGAAPMDPAAADGLSHVGSPAVARRAIAVANFVSKTSFSKLGGGTTTKTDEGVVGAGSASSSPGPTRDGRMKPEIGAPGAYLVSTLSADALNPESDDISTDGKHIAYTGTSMATPATCGTIALMLQAAKDRGRSLSPDQIKRLLWRTAANDNFTGPSISRKFGYGKLDALAAVKAVADNVAASELVSVSAGSFASDLATAPESIMAGFGANLAPGVEVGTTVPLPTTLAGVSVRVTDSAGAARLAPLFFVSAGQINYTVPAGTALGVARVDVVRDGNVVARGALSVNNVWPAFFTVNASGSGVGAANVLRVRANGEQVYEPANAPIDLSIPGDKVFLILFGSGLRGNSGLDKVRMTLGGTPLQPAYAGPQGGFVGLDQINVELPASLAGRGALDLLTYVDGWQANTIQFTIKAG